MTFNSNKNYNISSDILGKNYSICNFCEKINTPTFTDTSYPWTITQDTNGETITIKDSKSNKYVSVSNDKGNVTEGKSIEGKTISGAVLELSDTSYNFKFSASGDRYYLYDNENNIKIVKDNLGHAYLISVPETDEFRTSDILIIQEPTKNKNYLWGALALLALIIILIVIDAILIYMKKSRSLTVPIITIVLIVAIVIDIALFIQYYNMD